MSKLDNCPVVVDVVEQAERNASRPIALAGASRLKPAPFLTGGTVPERWGCSFRHDLSMCVIAAAQERRRKLVDLVWHAESPATNRNVVQSARSNVFTAAATRFVTAPPLRAMTRSSGR